MTTLPGLDAVGLGALSCSPFTLLRWLTSSVFLPKTPFFSFRKFFVVLLLVFCLVIIGLPFVQLIF